MMIEFRATLELLGSSRPLKNLGNLGNLGVSSELGVTEDSNENRSRFNLDNVGFFNSFYESKFIDITLIIEYTKKSIFFRNIYIFINRVKNIARIKGDKLL